MPYINRDLRRLVDDEIDDLLNKLFLIPESERDGVVNYCITKFIKRAYMSRDGLSYYNLNRAMGVLASVQHEYYRQVIAPYEDIKIKENGDVK